MTTPDARPRGEVTRALLELSAGDRGAFDRLMPLVYGELHSLAGSALRRERPDHTLSATGLTHEAWLRLVEVDRVSWRDRAHFLGACAQTMRRVLIDHARMKRAGKRGAGARAITIENVVVAADERPDELLALDEALTRLAQLSERQAKVIECRFYAGMSVEETGEALGISPATVKREWTAARAWLNRELTS